LGLPLSVKRLSSSDLVPLIHKVADHLPGWKVLLIHLAGRATLVKSVLTAIPVYQFIAVHCPKWVLKAIDKIHRDFLWKGRKCVQRGHCRVSWEWVCRPLELGGLGIHNLEALGWSLNMRWLWYKTRTEGPWRELQINVHPNAAALFAASVVTTIEDGANTFFWTYLWLHGAMDSPSPSLLLLWLEHFPNVWLEREQSRRLCNIHFGLVTSKDSCRSRS
jgi:hypothetical protein